MSNKNSARFVAEAWRQILEWEFQDQWNLKRVILGHKGNLWKATLKRLGINPTDNYSDIILLDDPKSTQISEWSWEDLLILDLTHGSLKKYLDALRIYRKTVWINEAYPPPSSDVIKYAESIWIKVIHIVWVSWSITPSLTDAYAWAVPCCMASELQEVESVIHREIWRMHPVWDLSLLEMS